jgi:hypothetical protein
MDPRTLRQQFLRAAAHEEVALQTSPLTVGVATMLRFYAKERAEGCDTAEDADMLLFQWGTYDWGPGTNFEVDIVRQVILPDQVDDDVIWQLHLTYRYEPTSALHAIGQGDRWCSTPAELDELEAFIEASGVVAAVSGMQAREVALAFEPAG